MASIFTKIINHEIPSEIIYEDERVIAINDINPKTPGHFLVIPKKESTNLIDINNNDFIYIILKAKELAKQRIKELKVSGFQLLINNGKEAGQEVMYTHIHIIPSRK